MDPSPGAHAPTLPPEQRIERLLAFQELLARVARDIGPALELAPVLRTVLRAMRSLVDFRGGSIILIEDAHLRVVAADPPDGLSPEVAAARLPVGSGIAGTAAATGEPAYSPDLDDDPRVDPELRRLGSNREIRSYLAVPLVVLGEVTGVLQIDSGRPHAFDDDDIRLLSGLATQVAGAIEGARRYEEILGLEQLKNDFIARVSHELRTPVTILAGFAETLLTRGDELTAQERVEALQRLHVASERLRHLVDELLAVASLEAGVSRPRPTEVDVRDQLELVRAVAERSSDVTVDVPDGLRVHVDARILRRVLHLLVDNALKYAGSVRIVAVAADGKLRIEVRDDGPGIPPALRERVFERFVRGVDSPPGLGLGLSLARTLAASIGAELALADDGRQGTTFVVALAGG